jgi:hypothetical protein
MQKSIGWIMLLVGMSLLFTGFAFQMATVTYETPTLTISPSFPSGTSSAPTLLKGGTLYTLEAYLTVLDVGSLTVKQVTITGTGYSQVFALTWTHTVNYDKIYNVWAAPTLPEGTLLTFLWHVETSTGATADVYSYGKMGGPVGKFYINGQEANIASVFTVSSPELKFKFIATQQGNLITVVWIKIMCSAPPVDTIKDLAETTADTEWTGTYTLPSHGTYAILGYITYGENSYRLMSVLRNYGSEFNTSSILGLAWMFLGLALMGIGVVLIVTGKNIKPPFL